MSDPKVLASLRAFVQGSRTRQIFVLPKCLGELFLQIIAKFGEINVQNPNSGNIREVDGKFLKVLEEWNGYSENTLMKLAPVVISLCLFWFSWVCCRKVPNKENVRDLILEIAS